ncbi:MAG: 1-acyl-sn-glycerol-3-phosphate acyltransferase [Candidatus Omnitrophica bacterium]|nr:1-acyl-sn-glycerol-3-phosphate acyltransferase [Candidatus Omnitrophota bacterium]
MRFFLSVLLWITGLMFTVLFWFAVFVTTILLYPFDKQRKASHWHGYWWSNAMVGMNPYWKLEITGLENIDKKQTYVIIANHQSFADIIVIYQIRTQFKWVAKESLFKVPFIGWTASLAKHIRITRGKFSSIKKVYREAATWLRSGMSVTFFPEGTRSETDDMGKFQNGAFKLAIKEKKPILPISITGTREAIPKGSWVFKANVTAHLKILSPVDTSSYKPGDFRLLRDKVHSMLEEAGRAS